MSDQDKSDHWNSLAAGLGATPPADDPAERSDSEEPEDVETVAGADTEEPVVERAQPQAARAVTPPPTDWGRLAGDLGVKIPDRPLEPASDHLNTFPSKADLDAPLRLTEEASAPVPLLTESTLDQAPAAEEDSVEEDSAEESNWPAEPAQETRDDGGFALGIFDDSAEVESDDEATDFIAEVAEVDILDTDMDVEETDLDATVTEEPPAEKKPGRRRRKRRPRGRRSSESRTEESPEPTPDDQSSEAATIGDDEEDALETSLVTDETESASTDSEEKPTKSKRRRRRRRGSSKKPATTAEDREPAEVEAQKPDDEPEAESDRAGKRRGRRKASSDTESDDSPEKGSSGKPAKDSHRGIPSWAEAIDVVVSANLENHKKNSGGGGSRSRGGRKRSGREKSSGKAK